MKITENIFFYPEKGMLDCNTCVIKGETGIIIDPCSPQFLPALLRDLYEDGINPKDISIITNTHLHADHCWANEAFKQVSGARIVIHPSQKQFYDVTVCQTAEFFGLQPANFKEDICWDKDSLKIGDIEIRLLHSPGHSPDSICFYCPQDKVLVCGDVIFQENTGRVDLPGGDAAQLRQSIERLSKLDIEHLLPGHMDSVSGVESVKNNFEFIKQNVLRWL